jgi:two-component system, cell cycle sensor histidine kinase and response regulator CckA
MENTSSPSISAKWQIIAAFIVISLIVGFTGYSYYSTASASLHEAKEREIKTIGDLKVDQLTQWSLERLADARVISRSPYFIRAVKSWRIHPFDISLKNDLTKRLLLPKEEYRYENIFIASPDGKLLMSIDSTVDQLDSTMTLLIRRAASTTDISVSDLYHSPLDKNIHYDLLAPIQSEKDGMIAILVFRIDPNQYLYPLIQSWPVPSRTSEATILRKDGDSIIFLNNLRYVQNSALHLRKSLTDKSSPGVQAVLGYKGIVEGLDYRGVHVLAYLAPVPHTDWILETKVDYDEIFSELYYRAAITGILTIISILLFSAGAALYYRSRQKNIYQNLFLKERELREYHEEFKTILYSIGDGVITTDVDGRIKQMNNTAAILTGWNEAEAKGNHLDDVFAIINETTRKTVASPLREVLKNGTIVGLANHTLLVSKDGIEIPIADSGAPIRDNDGKVNGTVLVFRDKTEEHQAEQKLYESELRLRRAVLNAPFPIMIHAEDGEVVMVSDAWTEITGYAHTDIPTIAAWTEKAYGKRMQLVLADIDRLYGLKERVHEGDYEVTTKSGDKRIWEFMSAPLGVLPDGRRMAISMAMDMTERRQVEAALKNSEERYSITLAAVDDGLWDWNIPTGMAVFSAGYYAILGYNAGEFPATYKAWREHVHPEEIDRVEEELTKSINSERGFIIDLRMKMKSGEWRWVSTRGKAVEKDQMGNAIRMVGTLSDITERKQTEDALRVSEQNYRTLADSGQALVWTSGPDMLCNYFNRVWLEFTGRSIERELGNGWAEGVHPDDLLQCVDIYTKAFDRRDKFSVEYRLLRHDGEYRLILEDGCPRYDNNGEFIGYIGHCLDITERKQTEAKLHRTEERLRQSEKMEAIGQLAGGIAHDFNNILGGIIGFTDLSLNLVDKGSVLDKNLHKVLTAAERAKHLVKQILAFSRQGNPQKSITSLRPIIKEVLELLKSSIPSSVIIKSDFQKDTNPVMADSTQIHQALLNLATNAVQAMKRKGTLSIKLYRSFLQEVKQAESGSMKPGEYTVIEVSDTGCGMDAVTQSRAFEPFYTTKAVGEGTGMGLSVVLGVVQSHGGDILIESEVGRGTTIRVFLPSVENAAGLPSDNNARIPIAGSERILFVDDEPALVEMADEILSPLGFTVQGFLKSVDALAFFSEHRGEIDLLITDQTMPEMTGLELIAKVHEINHELPVILCTGFSTEVDSENAGALGVHRLVMKPYGAYDIGKAVREVLDKLERLNTHG